MTKLIAIISLLLLAFQSISQNVGFEWAKSVRGTASDRAVSTTIYDAQDIYSTGIFQDTILDINDIPILTSNGSFDIYLQKSDNNGNIIWSKSFGGNGYDYVKDIEVDNAGAIYLTGYFTDTVDFDPNAGTYELVSNGLRDVFVQKLDSAGNFIWAKSIGGTGYEVAYSLDIDASDNIYFGGTFQAGTDFDPGTTIVTQPFQGGFYDCFIEKLDANGNFVWVKTIGGSEQDNLEAIDVDDQGNVYAVGMFGDTVDFDPGPNTDLLISTGNRNMFIQKLDQHGDFIWAKSIGDTVGYGIPQSVVVDEQENVYFTGYFYDTIDFDPGTGVSLLTAVEGFESPSDIFIEKLNQNGDFVWAKSIGGSSDDYSNVICLDDLGGVYIAASVEDTIDADPGNAVVNLIANGDSDILIEKLDESGNFTWVKMIGSTQWDYVSSLLVDSNKNIYFVGAFNETLDFDPTPSTFNLTATIGDRDGFIAKWSQENSASISEIMNDQISIIYPNPTEGPITIAFKENTSETTHIRIIDISGKIMFNQDVINQDLTIDLSNYEKGVYFINTLREGKTGVHKVIKQ